MNRVPGSEKAVLAAKAALCEAGYPNLAELVTANAIGVPTINSPGAHKTHRDVIVRAFWLGHLAAGHPATIGRSIDSDFVWGPSVDCPCVEEALSG